MGKPSVIKRRLRVLGIAGAIMVVPSVALATYPVFDATSFAKLTEQFNQLTKQLDELMEQTEILGKISNGMQDQINAIGKMGRVTMPIVNLARLSQQITKDARCLLPDLSGLMPDIDFDSVDWESICARRAFYKEMLWFDPEDPDSWQVPEDALPEDWSYPDGGNWGGGSGGDWKNPDASSSSQRAYALMRDLAREQVLKRQNSVVSEAINTGLAQSDQIVDQVESNQDTADELEANADAAEKINEHLAAMNKILLHQDRQMTAVQQQNAQMLRIQAAMLMKLMPPDASWEQAMSGSEKMPGEDAREGDE